MKRILAIILAVLLVAALAACGGSSSGGNSGGDNSGGTAEKGSVYWLNFKPELDETLQALAAKYTAATGVEVKVVTAASGSYNTTLTSEMDKSNPPTMFVIGNQQGVKDWGDFTLDLKGTAIANELSSDGYNLYDENGKLAAIGYVYECYGIVTNIDLIEQAGHTVDEITDFASLKAVAEDIHSRAAELGFDAFAAPDMDDANSWRLTGHVANLEYYYESRDAGGWKECPATLTGKYIENYKNLYDLAVNNAAEEPTSLATGGHDPANEFKTGKAAFFFTGSWDYADLSAAQPNITMLPYYCGVEGEDKAGLNCGTENYWAVNSTVPEADQQATIDFMVWLVTDEEASKTMVDQLGVMPYKKAAASENGFLAASESYSEKGCYVMDWATNYQPNVDEYRKDLVSALNAYNADQSDANWELVKAAFVDGWAKQYKAING